LPHLYVLSHLTETLQKHILDNQIAGKINYLIRLDRQRHAIKWVEQSFSYFN